jgi:DNA-binding transcriptional LysR family regulator
MELNQLKTFVTVAEEQHLTRAAERLFTSQPAVSAQIKALEETLGITLFDRTPKGMRLTPAGERLLAQATTTLDAARQLVSEAKAIKGEVFGELTVGVHTDFEFLKLADLVLRSKQQHPGIQLSLINGMSTDIILDIRKGNLDTGFFFGPCKSADLYNTQLASIELAIVGPVAWQNQVQHADLPALARLPWVYTSERCPFYRHTSSLFENTGIEPNKLVFVDSEDAIRHLVKTEVGIALLKKADAVNAVEEGWGTVWEGKVAPISLNMTMQTRRSREPLMNAWAQLVSDLWPEAEAAAAEFNTRDIG